MNIQKWNETDKQNFLITTWENFYWPLERRFNDMKYFFKRQLPGFFHRGKHGWAKHDTWNLDSHFSEIFIGSLSHLRDHNMGWPSSLNSEEEWKDILNKIIDGFKAYRRINQSDYDSELGVMPDYNRTDETQPAWDDYFARMKKLESRDQILFDDGMKLFVKYYSNFWD